MIRLQILFQDNDLIVVNKPAHLPSIPSRGTSTSDDLRSRLQRRFGDIFVVHRLDYGTSGVICFAKNANTHKALSIAFEKRKVHKKYLALVSGVLSQDLMSIEAPLLYIEAINKSVVSDKGKKSRTLVKVVQSFGVCSLVELTLETGRTHQIRAHLQFVGHPLLVDPKYGGREKFLLSSIKRDYRGERQTERPLLERPPLHASELTFNDLNYPTFFAPLPKDIKACVHQISKLQV